MYRLSCFPINRNHVYLQLQTLPIQLIVQSQDGSQFCVLLPYLAKGRELASVVEAKLGIPHNQQLLMYQQKKIDLKRLLVEQNITTGSVSSNRNQWRIRYINVV